MSLVLGICSDGLGRRTVSAPMDGMQTELSVCPNFYVRPDGPFSCLDGRSRKFISEISHTRV
jgi:hypothetical protein